MDNNSRAKLFRKWVIPCGGFFFLSLVCSCCTIWADISKSAYRPQTSNPNVVDLCMRCIHATLTLFLRCPELGYLDVLSRHNSFAGAVTAGAASVVFLETQVCIGLCAKRLEGFYNQLRLGNCRPTLYSTICICFTFIIRCIVHVFII